MKLGSEIGKIDQNRECYNLGVKRTLCMGVHGSGSNETFSL